MNHAFIDGNKRVGAHAGVLFLAVNGWEIAMTSRDLEEVTLQLAAGRLDLESLTIWFRQRSKPRE